MGQFVIESLPFDQLLQDVFQVGMDQDLNVFGLHLINMLDHREEAIVWLPQEHLSKIALIIDETEVRVSRFLTFGGLIDSLTINDFREGLSRAEVPCLRLKDILLLSHKSVSL